jgi:subtilisin family serine protease
MIFFRFILFLALLLIATQFLFSPKSSSQANESESYVNGEILVKFKPGESPSQIQSVHSRIGATVLKEFTQIGWQHIKLPDGMSVEEGIRAYKNLQEVTDAQPNYIYSINATPNDPSYSQLYGMTRISAPTAWDITTGSSSIVVAVIDTGVNYNHEDLTTNMWRNPGETAGNNVDDDGNGFVDDVYGYDFINSDSDPNDDNSHGSHCAGTIGATGNNGLGVAGVNWNVRIMALKTHASNGNSTAAAVIAAFQYARMMKNRGVNIRVTSSSWSGAPEAPGYDQALKDAIDAAGDAGILSVFASGNGARNIDPSPEYPASYTSPSILSIAASDSNDNKASFSNYGVVSVDVAAPGVSILSTVLGTSNYGFKSGTSMATPHTAGAAALLAAANPSLSAQSLKATLMNTVDALPQWNGNVLTGGRINIARAIQTQTTCNYSLTGVSSNMPIPGGIGFTTVITSPNCGFTVKSNVSWITLVSSDVGAGTTSVSFNVASNVGGAPRTGTLTIAGITFTVNQAGVNRTVFMDFDGDSKSDYAVIRNQSNQLIWYVFNGQNYSVFPFGINGDVAVPEDYDGDKKFDFAVWRPCTPISTCPGTFYVWRSSTNSLFALSLGNTNQFPGVTQDYDGDGKADPTVTEQVSGSFRWTSYLSQSNTVSTVTLAQSAGVPIRGDFDGDGKGDVALYTGTAGTPQNTFIIRKSSNSAIDQRYFGNGNTDYVVAGDFDGDTKTDLAIWRGKAQGTDGSWWWINSSTNTVGVILWGIGNYDLPVSGDYDGDGKTDVAIWRPDAQAAFYVNRSTQGFFAFPWGLGTDTQPNFGMAVR